MSKCRECGETANRPGTLCHECWKRGGGYDRMKEQKEADMAKANKNDEEWKSEGVPAELREMRFARDWPKLRTSDGARKAQQEFRAKSVKDFLAKLAKAESDWEEKQRGMELAKKIVQAEVLVKDEGVLQDDEGSERLKRLADEILAKWKAWDRS